MQKITINLRDSSKLHHPRKTGTTPPRLPVDSDPFGNGRPYDVLCNIKEEDISHLLPYNL